ncbi:MAG: pyridoxamine 5'-phosphate oxidase [Flavobacteriia bacterium]|nr:pyridoxamine 5'-phosphate oxidase [Flavobacteriia bacterium]
MKQDLSDKRRDYKISEIDFNSILPNPVELFKKWYEETQDSNLILEPNAMNVSAIGEDGFPRNRVVLLKEFNDEGFVFYTNYESQKGKAIHSNPNVCLSFFWDRLERQVIIKGVAEKISQQQSAEYFGKRPFESQIGAMVSHQSSVIGADTDLMAEAHRLEKEFEGKQVPKPDYWGGFLVRPVEIEFWQGRPSRLHDRLRYRLKNNSWITERLAP